MSYHPILVLLAIELNEIQLEDVAGAEAYGEPHDDAMAIAIETGLEGTLDIDVDDQYLTRQEADVLMGQAIEILYEGRDYEWSNPA